ncbi:hypothetical protein F5884DRAFT_895335 [Xylogone sp. PMI_703]|nr:hypothetical protein F5884DRAFT_895335 [Xylogone sp. PMI_703]
MTHDIEMQAVGENNREIDGSSPTDISPLSDRAGQCIFLCLKKKGKGQYAILVPCIRPTKPRKVILIHWKARKRINVYGDISPKEKACEGDSLIYHRLVETCFEFFGNWRRWLPFYGIVCVEEVQVFQFTGEVERDGLFPIFDVKPVKVDKLREEINRTIALEPDDVDIFVDDVCSSGSHSDVCQGMMILSKPCILEQIEAARQQERKLNMLESLDLLTNCARDPWTANGLRTLNGMAQKSCILDVEETNIPKKCEEYNGVGVVRGLQFKLGWQLDRIAYVLPYILCTWLSVALIWLCVVVWAGPTGDWSTALAFGQVIAVSISILHHIAHD